MPACVSPFLRPPAHDPREPRMHHHIHRCVLHRAPPPVLDVVRTSCRLRPKLPGPRRLRRSGPLFVGKSRAGARAFPQLYWEFYGAHKLSVGDYEPAETVAGFSRLKTEGPRLDIPSQGHERHAWRKMTGAGISRNSHDASRWLLDIPFVRKHWVGSATGGCCAHVTLVSVMCCPLSMPMRTFASDLRSALSIW